MDVMTGSARRKRKGNEDGRGEMEGRVRLGRRLGTPHAGSRCEGEPCAEDLIDAPRQGYGLRHVSARIRNGREQGTAPDGGVVRPALLHRSFRDGVLQRTVPSVREDHGTRAGAASGSQVL